MVAHPDDEVLGCGGAIARHTANGDEVHVLILATGITSRGTDEGVSELAKAAHGASDVLGVSSLQLDDYPDNKMDAVPLLDVVQTVERFVARVKPYVVYTHHWGDRNIDHRITCDAVLTACRPQPGQSVKTILHFEVPSSTEWGAGFAPDWFTEIDLGSKVKALRCYGGEMRRWPHARSFQAVCALAHWRGASVGVDAAEGFKLGRQVECL